jgi:hypothetical protein
VVQEKENALSSEPFILKDRGLSFTVIVVHDTWQAEICISHTTWPVKVNVVLKTTEKEDRCTKQFCKAVWPSGLEDVTLPEWFYEYTYVHACIHTYNSK